jgi:hypothetical protein
MRVSDQIVRMRLLRNVNLRARRLLVAIHFTHLQLSSNTCCLGNHKSALDSATKEDILFTDEFSFHVDFADGSARVWRGRIEKT